MKIASVFMKNDRVGSSAAVTLILLVLLLLSRHAIAAANLMVSPSRVVFDERMRTAQITLINQGDEAGNYRISFIRQQMDEDGQFVAVEDGEDGLFSDKMIRFSPRQVSLEPGQVQVVRLMLRKPRDLADGEYRSHMLFQSIPQAAKSGIQSALNQSQEGISVEIIPIVGISIPVIVRQGKLEGAVELKKANLVPAPSPGQSSMIALEMHRNGNRSVYGDFRAIYIPSAGDKALTVGLVNGVAVYTPNNMRRFAMPLTIPQGVSLKDGRIRIIFLESGKDEKSGLLAETEITLP